MSAETVVYVSNNCSQPSMPQPCYDFTHGLQALSEPHQSSLTAYIYPGQYSLEAGIVYFDVFNITLEAHDGLADIDCSEGSADEAGLSFIDSNMITIRNLSFSGCGIEYNSTTPSTSGDLVPFNATLYFEHCVDVTIQSVTVKESLGVGVQFYATGGTVTISDSTIANNPLNPEEGSIGGGLLIEFPLCSPSIESKVPLESTYDISGCNFTNNQAINAPFKERSGLPFGIYYSAFGYGGGLSVIFREYSNNNLIQISNCQWLHNEAVYGGGLYIGVQDNSYNNSVILTGVNVFTGNEAIKSGGGAVFAYLFSPETTFIDLEHNGNRFTVNGAHFTGNRAGARGGGMFYLTSRQSLTGMIQNLNQLTISDCVWKDNKGQLGSGLDLSILHSISEGTIHDVVLSNCSFLSNVVVANSKKGGVSTLGSGAMYIDAVPTIFDKLVTFCDNHDETALVVLRTKISFNSNTTAVFANNSGSNGGAIALHFSAFMEISAGTHFLFKDNTARSRGGAIYAESFGTSFEQTSLDCMIRYSNMTICPSEWDTNFNFSNNQANLRNNSIYASTIQPCAFLDGCSDDSSDIKDVFCWNDGIYNSSIWEYDSNTSQSACMEHIQTDIACFGPMSTNFSVTPGAPVVLDIKPLNDQDSVISEYIFHVYPSDDEAIKVDEDYNYISNNIVFVYPATNETKPGTIVLEAVQQNIVQLEVNVTFNECLAGLSLKNDAHNNLKCTCPPPYYGKEQVFRCENLTASATLLQGYWIGQYNVTNGKNKYENKTVFGHCISCNHISNSKSVHVTLNGSIDNVTEMLCSDHSKGVLCNECDEGYAPAISYDTFRCVQCNDTFNLTGIGFFITFRILLPLVFLIVIYIIDVPITSGLFHGPILLCQMVSTIVLLDAGGIIAFDSLFPGNGSYEALHKFQAVYTGLYHSFNLYYASSLLEKHCLSKKVRNFATVIAIDYIAAFIPLLVVILFALVHYCSRSFCNCCGKVAFGAHVRINPQRCRIFDNKRNKANFLATAILLSYTNVAVITSYLTTYVALLPTEGGKANRVLYLDGTIDFLSKQHLPYFVCACLFGVTYLLIVPLFLFFYRPNNPTENGGFLNHLLGQFQNEFRSGRAFNPNEDCKYKEPINTNKFKMEIKLQMWHLCQRMCFFYCKCRCSRHLNAFFITRFEHGNYQWFSSVLFLIRLLIVLPFVFSYNAFILLFFQFVISITYAIAVVLFHPYERMLPDGQSAKKIDPNIIEAASMMLLSLLIALSMYQYTYTMTDIPLSKWAFILQAILVWIPLVWIAIVYCVLFYIRHKEKLKNAWVGCCQLIWGRNCVVGDRDANNEEAPLVEGLRRNMELINSDSTKVYESRLAHSTEA